VLTPPEYGRIQLVPANARIHPRLTLHLPVRYKDGSELAASYIDSLSEGGVFVRTSRPLPIGTELTMEIAVKGVEDAPIRIRGRVVWERLIGRDDGMGVAFLEPPPARLKNILISEGA
jgi:uncharacterized protein (TIGR02266 family)